MKRLIDSIRRVKSGFSRFDPDGDPGPPVEVEGKRILLLYLFPALGDAVLLAPVVKALVDAGAKSVGVLLRKNAARIFKLVDLPVKIHAYPEELVIPAGDPAWEEAETTKLEKQLARYDIFVDLTLRDEVDCRRWMTEEAEARLGFIDPDEDATSVGLTWGTLDTRVQGERHWSKYLVLPLRCAGITEPDFDVGFSISKKAIKEAEATWKSGRRVLLVPGAQNEEKRFGEDRFVEIGKHVVSDGGGVVVCGAPDEGKLVRKIVKAIGKEVSAAYTKKNLEVLLALIQSAEVVVTNDTGPMHFAFLMGRPTVAVFTYMSAVCWGPPRKDPRFVTLNAPGAEVVDSAGIYTRAVIHHLDGLLARSA